ncbi:MAG: hypothetical protein ACJARG_001812 [Arcticibacterium sp.]|jgi:hypothetical protein
MDNIKLAQRTIALLSSMIESGEVHTTRTREMKDNAMKALEQVKNCSQSGVIVLLPSDIEPLAENFIQEYFYPDILAKGTCEETDNMKNFVSNWLHSKGKRQ